MLIPELRPEHRLLIGVARPDLDEVTVQSIKALLRLAIDWDYVLATARAHGVSPLLAHRVQSIGGDNVPRSIVLQLQTENEHNTQQALWMTGELIKIASAMRRAGIRFIPFKGPTLAVSSYGDLGLRPFTDLDLFVQADEIAPARELLLRAGFRLVRKLNRNQEAALLRFDNACAFVNEHDLLVDLHWYFAPRYFSLRLESKELWRRVTKVSVGDHLLPTLSPEDLIIVLCCHGFAHEWEKLVWIVDVAALVDRPDLDWEYLFQKAKRQGVLRIILVGLALAAELSSSLPQRASDQLQSDGLARKLAQEIGSHIFAPPDRKGLWKSLRHQLRMRERTRDKIATLVRSMLTPRDYDWMFASVPDRLRLLYYLIRPIRMVRARLLNARPTRNRNSQEFGSAP